MDPQARYRQIYEGRMMDQGGLYSGGARRRRRRGRGGVAIQGGGRKRKMRGGSGNNPWVNFLHRWAASHRMNYAQALKDPRASKAYHSGRY